MTTERITANATAAAASTVATKGKEALVALDQASKPAPQQVLRTRRPASDATTPMPQRSRSQGTPRPQRKAAPQQPLAAAPPQSVRAPIHPQTGPSDSFRPSDRKNPPTVTYDTPAAPAKTPPVSLDDGPDPRAIAAENSQAPAVSAKQMLASFDKLLQQVLGKDFKQPTNHAERTQLAGLAVKRLKGAAREQFLAQAESLGRDFGLNFGLSRGSAKGRQPLNAGAAGQLSAERSAAYNGLANEWRSGNANTGATQQPSPGLVAPTVPAEPAAANSDVAMRQPGNDGSAPTTSAAAPAGQTQAEPEDSDGEMVPASDAA